MTDKIQRVLLVVCMLLLFITIILCEYTCGKEQSKVEILQEELFSANEINEKLNKNNATLNERIVNLQNDLTFANTIIEDLKSETYEFVYLGNFRYTYYCNEPRKHICGMGTGMTSSGNPTKVGTTIAVDPSVIPMGSTVYIEGVGFRVAQDTGGGVKGKHIDILVNGHNEALSQTLVKGGVWVLVNKS